VGAGSPAAKMMKLQALTTFTASNPEAQSHKAAKNPSTKPSTISSTSEYKQC
jgi:hypothetical protein